MLIGLGQSINCVNRAEPISRPHFYNYASLFSIYYVKFAIVFYHQLLFILFIMMNNLHTCMNVLICGL